MSQAAYAYVHASFGAFGFARKKRFASSVYEIENALQDLRVSSGHKTFNNPFFCPWHEPRLAYTHKRVTFFSNFRKSVDDGGGKEYTFTNGGLTSKATPKQ